jgi:nitrate/nitrite transporter NarK
MLPVHRAPPLAVRPQRDLRAVLANGSLWRIAVLHSATFGSSIVVGAWIIEYLDAGGATSRVTAGLIGALLLTLTGLGRPVGGWLVAHGAAWGLVAVAGALATAAGLAALVISRDLAVVLPASLLVGVGFALPFAATFHAAVRAEPDRAASASALVNLLAASFALVAAPLVGLDLDRADGRLSFGLLAALALLAAVLNRRPPAAA